jgi:hypothetical protein
MSRSWAICAKSNTAACLFLYSPAFDQTPCAAETLQQIRMLGLLLVVAITFTPSIFAAGLIAACSSAEVPQWILLLGFDL